MPWGSRYGVTYDCQTLIFLWWISTIFHIKNQILTLLQTHFSMVNSVWPSDAIWPKRSGSTMVWVLACCLTAPSHYPNHCWLLIGEALWHSPGSNFTESAQAIILYDQFHNHTYRVTVTSLRDRWVNSLRLSDTIWRKRSGSTLAQVMACCLTAPSHYLNQCWLITSKV